MADRLTHVSRGREVEIRIRCRPNLRAALQTVRHRFIFNPNVVMLPDSRLRRWTPQTHYTLQSA